MFRERLLSLRGYVHKGACVLLNQPKDVTGLWQWIKEWEWPLIIPAIYTWVLLNPVSNWNLVSLRKLLGWTMALVY